MKLLGYTCVTNCWDEFTKAERSGIVGIKDTYIRLFNEWKSNYVYLTELTVVLNCKILQFYDGDVDGTGKRTEIARAYSRLWEGTQRYAETNLRNEELRYYHRITD